MQCPIPQCSFPGLRLPNTDWVILSACNTAAGDGSGEGLADAAPRGCSPSAKPWGRRADERASPTLWVQPAL